MKLQEIYDKIENCEPVFVHDCDQCVFLGHWRNASLDPRKAAYMDLYYCPSGKMTPTLIARYGNDGPQYSSGCIAGFIQHSPAIALAAELAIHYLTGPKCWAWRAPKLSKRARGKR